MKKPTAAKANQNQLKQLTIAQLAGVSGGDNPGMGPYDAPAPAPTGRCWVQIGGIYMPNDIAGVDCPLVTA